MFFESHAVLTMRKAWSQGRIYWVIVFSSLLPEKWIHDRAESWELDGMLGVDLSSRVLKPPGTRRGKKKIDNAVAIATPPWF
jgi:hypothetical protein